MRCSICAFEQVNEVGVLLASGTSIRKVSQMFGLARSTVARHRQHVSPLGTKFGVIRTEPGPSGPADPLAEALVLAERARTPRERLRALEQVRGATKLALRGADVDEDGLGLLNRNIRDAEAAYRDASDFETTARALQGLRESIRQRVDAVKPEKIAPTQIAISFFDAAQGPSEGPLVPVSPTDRDIPRAYRDVRFAVQRTTNLSWHDTKPLSADVKVYEGDVLAWASGLSRRDVSDSTHTIDQGGRR